jgi:hypothetical protein
MLPYLSCPLSKPVSPSMWGKDSWKLAIGYSILDIFLIPYFLLFIPCFFSSASAFQTAYLDFGAFLASG